MDMEETEINDYGDVFEQDYLKNYGESAEITIDPSDALYPIAVLIDEMRNDNVQLRLNSITNIKTIAFALGPERTREELIPFLADKVHDDDEILLVMADKLGDFTPLVGGEEYAHVILKPLEMLCAIEDSLVRSKTISSLTKVITSMTNESICQWVVPMAIRLVNNEWYTCRCASASILVICYDRVDDQIKREFMKLYISLLEDTVATVRRAAVRKFSSYVEVVEFDNTCADLIPVFNNLAVDNHDSVRLMVAEEFSNCVNILVHGNGKSSDMDLVKKLDPDSTANVQQVEHFFEILEKLVSDCSWRIRCVIAKHIFKFQEALKSKIETKRMAEAYRQFLTDVEPEVKSAACMSFTKFMETIPEDERKLIYTTCFSDYVISLSSDPNEYVKKSLSSVIMQLSPLMGNDFTISHLLPIYVRLLKDDCSDVRLNIISNLSFVNDVLGLDQLTECLLPAMFNLANDSKWRVRLAILNLTPILASQLGIEFFNKEFLTICFEWLDDSVYEVRRNAADMFLKIIIQFGADWASERILQRLIERLSTCTNYLRRLSFIHCLALIAQPCGVHLVKTKIAPVLINLATDKVSNVRFNVCKAFYHLNTLVDEEMYNQDIKPVLMKLVQTDKDSQVKYHAQLALDHIHKSSKCMTDIST